MPFLPPNQQRQSTEGTPLKNAHEMQQTECTVETRVLWHVTMEKFTYWNGVQTQNECADSGTAQQEVLTAIILRQTAILLHKSTSRLQDMPV